MNKTPKRYRLLVPVDHEDVDLNAVAYDLEEREQSIVKVVKDALDHWDHDFNQPGMEGIDRMMSMASGDDFAACLEISIYLSSIAERIQHHLKQRIQTLIENTLAEGESFRFNLIGVSGAGVLLEVVFDETTT